MAGHMPKKKWKKAHVNGCVTKCLGGTKAYTAKTEHAYRYQGHRYAIENHKDVFDVDFTSGKNEKRFTAVFGNKPHREVAHGLGVKRKVGDPRVDRNAWCLEEAENFTKGYRPYNHDSHHLIPCEAIAESFDTDERLLIMEAKYNVNLKGNVLILPKHEKVGHVLGLPIHYSNHAQFTEFVMCQLASIRFAMTDEKNKHAITEKNSSTIKDEMVNLQDELRGILLAIGEAQLAAGDFADLEQFDTLMMAT